MKFNPWEGWEASISWCESLITPWHLTSSPASPAWCPSGSSCPRPRRRSRRWPGSWTRGGSWRGCGDPRGTCVVSAVPPSHSELSIIIWNIIIIRNVSVGKHLPAYHNDSVTPRGSLWAFCCCNVNVSHFSGIWFQCLSNNHVRQFKVHSQS